MKSFTLTLAIFCALCAVSFAGSEQYSGKEMKQVAPAPCPEWYADNEWNVSVWGAYAWSATENNRSTIEDADDLSRFGSYDRFLAEDHAWGGGLDVKYFFHRYFGIGVEGVALSGHSRHGVFDHAPDNADEEFYSSEDHTIGGALGTFTIRYPFRCTRFSPYVWGGFGGFFNGNNDQPRGQGADSNVVGRFMDNQDESRIAGQVGGGLEVRVTRHIGITGDVSWNFLEGPHNNFGMVRSGLNFAF